MSDTPATPEKSGETGTMFHAKVGVLHAEDNAATKVSSTDHEPSPASTYGVSAIGNSVPATPQDVEGQSFY